MVEVEGSGTSKAANTHLYTKSKSHCTFEPEVAMLVDIYGCNVLSPVKSLGSRCICLPKVCYLPSRVVKTIPKICNVAFCPSWQQLLRLRLLVLNILHPTASWAPKLGSYWSDVHQAVGDK